jgi:transcriptional regulator with XRE-family HTH domain
VFILIKEDRGMFAENLKKIRKDKGYTQEILAEKLNVVRQTVSKWEKGLSLPDVDMLSKIANVLETDVNILLDGQITTTDQSEIVKQLAKINEQLTIKNRRYKKIMKTIAIILLIIVIFGILLVILNIGTFISISNSETTTTVETMIKEVVR